MGRMWRRTWSQERQLPNGLHFASEFNNLKKIIPSIPNDFSYYRRTLSRLKSTHQVRLPGLIAIHTHLHQVNDVEVNDELADRTVACLPHSSVKNDHRYHRKLRLCCKLTGQNEGWITNRISEE